MSMRDEEEQQEASRHHKAAEQDPEEQRFLRLHPGWLQAAWAHPEWPEWQRKRMQGALK